MSLVFREETADLVQKALEASAKTYNNGDSIREMRQAKQQELGMQRAALEGGDEALDFLIRKPGEDPDDWSARMARFFNVKLVETVVNVKAALWYGNGVNHNVYYGDAKPMRKSELAYQYLEAYRGGDEDPVLESAEQIQNQNVQDVYSQVLRENHAGLKFYKGGRLRINDGDSWCKVSPRIGMRGGMADTFLGLSLGFKKATENFLPVFDPDDDEVLLGGVEVVRTGDEYENRLWSLSYFEEGKNSGNYVAGYQVIGDDFSPTIEAPTVLGIDTVPFVRWGDGRSLTGNAAHMQKHLVNLHSIDYLIRLAQGFAVPVLSGEMKENLNPDGSTKLGPLKLLELEIGAAFAYVSPEADLAEHGENIIRTRALAFKQEDVPTDFYQDHAGVEQPEAKMLSWMTTLLSVKPLVDESKGAHEQLARVIGSYLERKEVAQHYGLSIRDFKADDVGCEIDFPSNPLPTDDRANAQADREAVMAGTMLVTEYIERYDSPDLSAKQIGYKAYLLEKEQERRRKAGFMNEGLEAMGSSLAKQLTGSNAGDE